MVTHGDRKAGFLSSPPIIFNLSLPRHGFVALSFFRLQQCYYDLDRFGTFGLTVAA